LGVVVAGANRVTLNLNDELGPGLDFGMEIQSDAPLVVERPEYVSGPVAQIPLVSGGTDAVARAASPRWHFAEGTTRQGFQEYVTLANPTTGTASVSVSAGGATTTLGIPQGRRATIDVNALVGSSADVDLEISSSAPIAAERLMYFSATLPGVGLVTGAHNSTGASDWAQTLYFAEGTNRPGFDPFLTVQNPGPPVTATLTPLASGLGPLSIPLVSGRTTVYLSQLLPAVDFGLLLQSPQAVAAERVIYFNTSIPGIGTISNATVSPGSTTPALGWSFAEGTSRPGFQPYLLIANPGTTPAAVTVGLVGGANASGAVWLDPNTRVTVDLAALAGPGLDFGITVTASSPVVVERVQYAKAVVGALSITGSSTAVVGVPAT
jgi:hypothetical protein